MGANAIGEVLKKTFVYQAIFRAVEGVSDRTTVVVGNYRIDMVYDHPYLSLTLYYQDGGRTVHLAAYEGVSRYTGNGTEKKVTGVIEPFRLDAYIHQYGAFKLALAALGYFMTEPDDTIY